MSGKRVLLIDLDSQGNATAAAGVIRTSIRKTIFEVLIDSVPSEEAVLPSAVERLELLPASQDLAGADISLSSVPDRDIILRKSCESLKSRYEVIILDCPPSLGLITINALTASDYVIIPVQCEYLALEGLSALVKTIDAVKGGRNRELRIGGIVLTMTDFRSNLAREVAEEVKRFFPGLVFEAAVPRNIRLAESPSFGKPIALYDPTSSGAVAYQSLSDEVMKKVLGDSPQPSPQHGAELVQS